MLVNILNGQHSHNNAADDSAFKYRMSSVRSAYSVYKDARLSLIPTINANMSLCVTFSRVTVTYSTDGHEMYTYY